MMAYLNSIRLQAATAALAIIFGILSFHWFGVGDNVAGWIDLILAIASGAMFVGLRIFDG